MTARSGAADFVGNDVAAPRVRVPDVRGSYEAYISSGLYDRRYPHPNGRTLRKSLDFLRGRGRFLDFGAGTGRYTLPLMERTGASGVAYDVCPAACRALADRLRGFVEDGRLVIHDGGPEALVEAYRRSFDLALMAFGVLAHVAGRAERLRLLDAVRRMLKPEGVLVLGLPNARRRFQAARRAAAPLVRAGELEAGDILYTRGRDSDGIRLFYHLFSSVGGACRPLRRGVPDREHRARKPVARVRGRRATRCSAGSTTWRAGSRRPPSATDF